MKKYLVLFILAIALIGCGALGGLKGKSIRYINTEKNIDVEASVSADEKLEISVNSTKLIIEPDKQEDGELEEVRE